jgi:hypothetical protein
MGYPFTIRLDRLGIIDESIVRTCLAHVDEETWAGLHVFEAREFPRLCNTSLSQWCTYSTWLAELKKTEAQVITRKCHRICYALLIRHETQGTSHRIASDRETAVYTAAR